MRTLLVAALASASFAPAIAQQPSAVKQVSVYNVDFPIRSEWRAVAKAQKRHFPVSRSASPHTFGTVEYNKWFARAYMSHEYGWGEAEFLALEQLWQRESGWSQHAHNPTSGAHGIPQSLPGSKMAMFGQDWASNPETQIKWGLHYIKSGYGTPSAALGHSHSFGWY